MDFLNIQIIITALSWALLLLLCVKVFVFVSLSIRHYRKSKKSRRRIGKYRPLVSVIVPAYNEELTLENCIKSLLAQTYNNIEIVIVDDGSKDGTSVVGRRLQRSNSDRIRFFGKRNGGKASALNYGIFRARGEIVVSMDADSMFTKDSLRQLVLSFCDPRLVAVGGNVKVANRDCFMGKFQAIEYIAGLNIQRRSFATLNCMQVISGAIGAFRRQELIEVGGYSSDTIVEDMDITVTLARLGHRVDYNGKAVAYTEAPESVSDFLKQRYRWTYGGFQVTRKHLDLMLNPRHGNIGMVGMPYFAIFPWIDVLISFLFFFALARAVVAGQSLGLLAFYITMSFIQGLLLYYALSIDKEKKRLALLSGLDCLWYNHLISFVTIKAGVNYLRGKNSGWNKLKRLGKNYSPSL